MELGALEAFARDPQGAGLGLPSHIRRLLATAQIKIGSSHLVLGPWRGERGAHSFLRYSLCELPHRCRSRGDRCAHQT